MPTELVPTLIYHINVINHSDQQHSPVFRAAVCQFSASVEPPIMNIDPVIPPNHQNPYIRTSCSCDIVREV